MVPDLIYDVGLHDGSDTAYYLSQGYRVVAIEANPILVDKARERFREEIEQERLELVNVGVGPKEDVVPFWVNDERLQWSSFEKEWGCRQGTKCHQIDVQCVRFEEILKKHGVPFYLKIDIEGFDIHCLRALTTDDLPQYVSVEAHDLDCLGVMATLGYKQFKCLNQIAHNDDFLQRRDNEKKAKWWTAVRWKVADMLAGCLKLLPFVKSFFRRIGLLGLGRKLIVPRPAPDEKGEDEWDFPIGSSGPFGEDTFGEWEDLETVAYNFLHHRFAHTDRGTLNPDGWYDFHAKLD